MDLANGKHDFHLTRPIMVHFSGDGDKEVTLIELHEPSRVHLKKASRLKQMVVKAMMDASKFSDKSEDEEEEEVDGEEVKPIHEKTDEEHKKEAAELAKVLKMALLASDIDFGEFNETFIAMALKSSKKELLLLDGKVPIKSTHFDDMSVSDIESLAVTYASFFLMPSEMQET